MHSLPQQLRIPNTLDVEAVERALAQLWQRTTGESKEEDAVLRARAANLMVFLSDQLALAETHQIIAELSAVHPCRALVMSGGRDAPDSDIELYVSAFCPKNRSSMIDRLCCEEITLAAGGKFISELPSAAVPLLVPDLPAFLWWRDVFWMEDAIFDRLCLAVDRVVIDSADFKDPALDLLALARLCNKSHETPISDLNWARLTSWRALLASFYDVQDYRSELDQIVGVEIDYVAQDATHRASSQAMLIAGWLASRLGWEIDKARPAQAMPEGLSFNLAKNSQSIRVNLNVVERHAMKAGRLVQVSLKTSNAAVFAVTRSDDGLYLGTQAKTGGQIHPGRVSPLRNPSAAQLLSREMEILGNDRIYEEALEFVARMIQGTWPLVFGRNHLR
ncbi:MAG: glucose-6-phosphate dehydrogenase assembly protein OpcA [Pyrinomonadaceae bacterium]